MNGYSIGHEGLLLTMLGALRENVFIFLEGQFHRALKQHFICQKAVAEAVLVGLKKCLLNVSISKKFVFSVVLYYVVCTLPVLFSFTLWLRSFCRFLVE